MMAELHFGMEKYGNSTDILNYACVYGATYAVLARARFVRSQ